MSRDDEALDDGREGGGGERELALVAGDMRTGGGGGKEGLLEGRGCGGAVGALVELCSRRPPSCTRRCTSTVADGVEEGEG